MFAAAIAALTAGGAASGGAATPRTKVAGVTGRHSRTPSGFSVHSVEPGVGVDSVTGSPGSVVIPTGVSPPPAPKAAAGKTTATITPIAKTKRVFQPTPWDTSNRSPLSAYGVSCRAGAEGACAPTVFRWIRPKVGSPVPRFFGPWTRLTGT